MAVVFYDHLNPYALTIRADVWDEGSRFFVFDTSERYGPDDIPDDLIRYWITPHPRPSRMR